MNRDMTIGKALKKAREFAKLTQNDIEQKTGIKREYLCRIENNKLKNPTWFTIAKIAEAIQISLPDLMKMVDTIDIPVINGR